MTELEASAAAVRVAEEEVSQLWAEARIAQAGADQARLEAGRRLLELNTFATTVMNDISGDLPEDLDTLIEQHRARVEAAVVLSPEYAVAVHAWADFVELQLRTLVAGVEPTIH